MVVGRTSRTALAGKAGRATAALARVHRRDELNARGIGDAVVGARNHSLARLQRLAQRIKYAGLEFRQLVKEKNAEVGQAHLTGFGTRAAADEGCHAG